MPQERHKNGLFPDPGPPLGIAKRCLPVPYGFQASCTLSSADLSDPYLGCYSSISDAELQRVGWVKMEDPLAQSVVTRVLWVNKYVATCPLRTCTRVRCRW